MGVFTNTYLAQTGEILKKYAEEKIAEDLSFYDIYLTTLINTFKWSKIPVDLPSFMPEQFLQYSGRLGIFENNGIKILPIFPAGSLMENGEYTQYTAIAMNGKTYRVDYDDVVIIFNNCTKTGYAPLVQHFSNKTSYALRAVESALQKAIMGTIIGAETEDQVNLINQLNDKEKVLKPFVAMMRTKFTSGEFERISVFDNRENDVIALWDVYVRYRNLFYSTFGVNNVEIQKRERLTEAEGSGNDEIVRYSLLYDMYNQRIVGINKANEKFGIDIKIEINRDSSTVYELTKTNEEKIEDMQLEMTRGTNLPTGGVNNAEED